MGFNLGLNLNEAINCGYDDWLQAFKRKDVDNCKPELCKFHEKGSYTLNYT